MFFDGPWLGFSYCLGLWGSSWVTGENEGRGWYFWNIGWDWLHQGERALRWPCGYAWVCCKHQLVQMFCNDLIAFVFFVLVGLHE